MELKLRYLSWPGTVKLWGKEGVFGGIGRLDVVEVSSECYVYGAFYNGLMGLSLHCIVHAWIYNFKAGSSVQVHSY